MNEKRRKELISEWKNRRPEMGLISITCKATGEMFTDISTDTKFVFNRHRFQLSAGLHPNKELQDLWERYGEEEFEYTVVKVFKPEQPETDPIDKLNELLEEYLAAEPKAKRLTQYYSNTRVWKG